MKTQCRIIIIKINELRVNRENLHSCYKREVGEMFMYLIHIYIKIYMFEKFRKRILSVLIFVRQCTKIL